MIALLFGLGAAISTFLGGLFALRRQDKLHLILGFSAGAVVGVALFDLLPESLSLAQPRFADTTVTALVAFGFLAFMLLSRVVLLHPHGESCENETHQGRLGAASLSIHSFLDGIGIGVAFQVSPAVGAIVAAAVLTHDFSDGINTVSFVLEHEAARKEAKRWLTLDALAPLAGVICASFLRVPAPVLGAILAVFCGFFLYIGASDLLPESHHRHPQLITSILTVLGTAVIYLAVHFAKF
ncbi:MAG TPA: ZIP family metal transporter [Capsulimonadaceae bacterium]|nr:ZIP family metal transporter [Capsulimonadaceae bacterium]